MENAFYHAPSAQADQNEDGENVGERSDATTSAYPNAVALTNQREMFLSTEHPPLRSVQQELLSTQLYLRFNHN